MPNLTGFFQLGWKNFHHRFWVGTAVDHRQYYDCSRSLSQKPSEACVLLLPLPSALGSNQSYGISRVSNGKWKIFPISSGRCEITEVKKLWKIATLCVQAMQKWEQVSHVYQDPIPGTGWWLAITEGLAPSRQITQTAATLLPNGWSPSCIQLCCHKQKTAPKHSE